jgi:HlyD family secretion protein
VLGSVSAVVMAFIGVASASAAERDDAVYQAAGYVTPKAQVTVSARVAGQVVELNIEEGKVVKKGDVLARLDASEYKADLEAAKARVLIATTKVERSKAGVPDSDAAVANAELTLAKVGLSKAQARLDATAILAPIDGTILTKKAEVGNVLHPLGFNIGSSICEMANLKDLEVDVSIPEGDIRNITTAQPCRIVLDAFPDTTYRGKVSRIMPIADRSKGTLSVRIKVDVPEKDQQLRPEMRARVSFLDKK